VYDVDVDNSTAMMADVDVDANVKSAFVTVQRTTATVAMHDALPYLVSNVGYERTRHRVLPTTTAPDGGDLNSSHWFPHQGPDVKDWGDDVRHSLSGHDVYDVDVDNSTAMMADVDVDANVKSAFVTVQRTTATVVMHDALPYLVSNVGYERTRSRAAAAQQQSDSDSDTAGSRTPRASDSGWHSPVRSVPSNMPVYRSANVRPISPGSIYSQLNLS